MTDITIKNAQQVAEECTKRLQIAAQHSETFQDFAEICACLSDISKTILVTSGHKGYEDFDSTTKTNLEVLAEILDASSKLFYSCDEYYR